MSAYHRRLIGSDEAEKKRVARAWSGSCCVFVGVALVILILSLGNDDESSVRGKLEFKLCNLITTTAHYNHHRTPCTSRAPLTTTSSLSRLHAVRLTVESVRVVT